MPIRPLEARLVVSLELCGEGRLSRGDVVARVEHRAVRVVDLSRTQYTSETESDTEKRELLRNKTEK